MKKRIILLSSLFLLLALFVCLGFTMGLDDACYNFWVSKHTPFILGIASFFSFFASTKGLIIVSFLLLFLLPDNKKRFFTLLGLIVSALVIVISKNVFTRDRPLIGQAVLTDYSFPSGHSFVATFFYGLLIYHISKSNWKKEKKLVLSLSLGLFIFLIALSRIVLGVHYLTDILGGLLFGLTILLIFISCYERLDTKDKKELPLKTSFTYAFHGIKDTLQKERNMFFHVLVMFLVIIAGVLFHISFFEWIICLILFGLIFSLELVNTAVENAVDLVTKEKKEKARLAKDAAAGAVLIMAIFAGIVGIVIFLPKLLG